MSTLDRHYHHNPPLLGLLLGFTIAILAHSFIPPASSSILPTTSPHGTLSMSTSGNITTVTISNPPINLYDTFLSADMFSFLSSLNPSNRSTPPPKVVIFRSADPNFFIAHLDVSSLLLPSTPEKTAFVGQYVAVTRLLQSLTTTVFIAEIDGEAFGAGNELLVQMDMRFAGPKARVGSLETSIGVTHGAGGMQFLGRLINKGRAMQYLLSGDGADCKTGKELGWFNDCFGSKKEMEDFVEALAERIALRPAGALNATKAGLQSMNPPLSVLQADLAAFAPLSVSPEAQLLTKKFLRLGKNETRTPFELGLDATLAELFQ
ncbi:unnamed protein product [Calypogeia fissa]